MLDRDDPDPLRWTEATPLLSLGKAVLVLAEIRKGARHQIRAHLAGSGFPILGDATYGHGEPCGLRLAPLPGGVRARFRGRVPAALARVAGPGQAGGDPGPVGHRLDPFLLLQNPVDRLQTKQ